jgi:hypothetical protein
MYHHTESMVQMAEDMMRQASQMEKEVKMMLEMEGRAWGIELDRRKNARALMEELASHQENNEHPAMTWAYVPEDAVEYDTAMPDDYAPYDPQEHWHDDGTMHSHEDGMEPHTHDPA